MFKLQKTLALAPVLLLLMPVIAQADLPVVNPTSFTSIATSNLVNSIFSFFWPFVVGAVIAIMIGVGFMFLTSRGSPEKAVQGSQAFVFGVVGVAVILLAFSVFAIVQFMLGGG